MINGCLQEEKNTSDTRYPMWIYVRWLSAQPSSLDDAIWMLMWNETNKWQFKRYTLHIYERIPHKLKHIGYIGYACTTVRTRMAFIFKRIHVQIFFFLNYYIWSKNETKISGKIFVANNFFCFCELCEFHSVQN